MSETAFPINDLLRRRLQTGLTVLSLTTCVASTLFLLLFSGQIGLGIASVSQETLTVGVSNVLSQFLVFVSFLFFVVGAVIISFIVFLLMAQRTRDYGLMKATGCPNGLVFGYFFTELLFVTLLGCVLGVAVGFAADYLVLNLGIFHVYNQTPNFWFAPLVFVVFFVFALIFGAKPMFEAARASPIKALSPVQYFGISKETKLKPLSKRALTLRIASRSLFSPKIGNHPHRTFSLRGFSSLNRIHCRRHNCPRHNFLLVNAGNRRKHHPGCRQKPGCPVHAAASLFFRRDRKW